MNDIDYIPMIHPSTHATETLFADRIAAITYRYEYTLIKWIEIVAINYLFLSLWRQ